MKTFFVTLVYYLGLSSCAVHGMQKSTRKCFCTQKCYISALLSSFAGGLIRDTAILHIYPVVFTINCLPEIAFVLITSFLYSHVSHNQKHIDVFTVFTDAAGTGRFLTLGVDMVLSFKDDFALAVLSGACTGLCGSIASSIFVGEPIKHILLSNLSYKFFSIAGAALYTDLIKSNIDKVDAQIAIVIYTLCILTVCNNIKFIKKMCTKAIYATQIQNAYGNWILLGTLVSLYICSRQFYSKLLKATDISKRSKIHNQKQIFYLYHRIRQM